MPTRAIYCKQSRTFTSDRQPKAKIKLIPSCLDQTVWCSSRQIWCFDRSSDTKGGCLESRTVRKEGAGAKTIFASFPLKVSACLVSSGFAAIILKTWMLAYSITGRCSLCGRAISSLHNMEILDNTNAFAEGVSGVHRRGRRLTFYFAGVAHRCNLVLHKSLFVALHTYMDRQLSTFKME